MPSIAQAALARGFSNLLVSSGETLNFRGSEITCLVDRNLSGITDDPNSALDFNGRQSMTVEMDSDAVFIRPRFGERVTEEDGTAHRVVSVRPVLSGWRVELVKDNPIELITEDEITVDVWEIAPSSFTDTMLDAGYSPSRDRTIVISDEDKPPCVSFSVRDSVKLGGIVHTVFEKQTMEGATKLIVRLQV